MLDIFSGSVAGGYFVFLFKQSRRYKVVFLSLAMLITMTLECLAFVFLGIQELSITKHIILILLLFAIAALISAILTHSVNCIKKL